jgi:hypothetical protein
MGWGEDPVDYEDLHLVAEIPEEYLRHFNGDAARAYRAMKAAWGDSYAESKKAPDTFIDVEDLPEDKRYLVEKIMSLTDDEVRGLRTIVDQVLALRGK